MEVMSKQKVWDLPVRICHWSLVLLIIFQYLSAEVLNDSILPNPIQWHFYGGYCILAVLIFRICWGFLGTKHAKFIDFVVGPSQLVSYFRGHQHNKIYLGHNPAGAFSVIALISLILSQAVSGLFITDDIFNDGPYYSVLSEQYQDWMNFVHHNAFDLLLVFIGLHVLAILYYKYIKHQGLTRAMLTGYKYVDDRQVVQTNIDDKFPWIGFISCLVITGVIMYLILVVFVPPPSDDFYY